MDIEVVCRNLYDCDPKIFIEFYSIYKKNLWKISNRLPKSFTLKFSAYNTLRVIKFEYKRNDEINISDHKYQYNPEFINNKYNLNNSIFLVFERNNGQTLGYINVRNWNAKKPPTRSGNQSLTNYNIESEINRIFRKIKIDQLL